MTCRHYWLIEIANGSLSRGRCKRCGEERNFKNSVAEWGPAERSAAAHTQYCTPRMEAALLTIRQEGL